MTIYLYDVINLSGITLFLDNRVLPHITTNINAPTGDRSNKFVLSYKLPGSYAINIYTDGPKQLIINLFRDSGVPGPTTQWDILRDHSRYSFVVEKQKIWFYSTSRDLALNGEVSDGWFVQLDEPNWEWKPYNIKTTSKAVVKEVVSA